MILTLKRNVTHIESYSRFGNPRINALAYRQLFGFGLQLNQHKSLIFKSNTIVTLPSIHFQNNSQTENRNSLRIDC